MPESISLPVQADAAATAGEHAAQFARDGFFIARNLLSPADLAPVITAIERAVDVEAQRLFAAGAIRDLCAELPFHLRWHALIEQQGGPQASSGWNETVFGPEIYGLLANPKLHQLLEPLIGAELWANGDYWVRPKRPNEDLTTLPWHQDSTYYEDPTTDLLLPTLWMPLVDVDEVNGCLEIIAGSHLWGLQATVPLEGSWFRVPVEEPTLRGEALALPMRVGDVLCFSNLTFHRSLMNTSDHVRWSIDLRYSRTGTWLPFVETRFPGFRARSAAQPSQVESFATWQRRKQFVAAKQVK